MLNRFESPSDARALAWIERLAPMVMLTLCVGLVLVVALAAAVGARWV
ncbi:MAG: hypothetical protein AMXMBFR53_20320 [Gemmatimonadota bacterium]